MSRISGRFIFGQAMGALVQFWYMAREPGYCNGNTIKLNKRKEKTLSLVILFIESKAKKIQVLLSQSTGRRDELTLRGGTVGQQVPSWNFPILIGFCRSLKASEQGEYVSLGSILNQIATLQFPPVSGPVSAAWIVEKPFFLEWPMFHQDYK